LVSSERERFELVREWRRRNGNPDDY